MNVLMMILSGEFLFAISTMLFVSGVLSKVKDLSKTGAILCGIGMILVAGWVAYRIQFNLVAPLDSFVKYLKLNDQQRKNFTDSAGLVVWIVPFFTAAWGTNLISDAISRNFSYRSPWRPLSVFDVFRSPRRNRAKLAGLSIEDQRIIVQIIHRELLAILAQLPQFSKKRDSVDELLNMKDGTIVKIVPLTTKQPLYDDFLHVLWPGNVSFQKVDSRRYIELQFLIAGSYEADLGSYRREAEAVYRELYGY